jgi:IS30 family transposase
MLLGRPDNRRAETVRDVIARKIQKQPADLIRSLTWDQGKEMGQHAQFTQEWPSTFVTHTASGSEAPSKTPTASFALTP